MPLSCELVHGQISALQGLHVAAATRNCGILSKSRVYPTSNSSCIPFPKPTPHTPTMNHSPCLPNLQTPFLFKQPFTVNPSLPRPTHWPTTNTLRYIDSRSNSVILHSLHMAEPLENIFINLFLHPLRHSTQFPYLCIQALSVHSGLYPFFWYPANL